MGTVHFFEKDLAQSSAGEPDDMKFTIGLFEGNGYMHLVIRNPDDYEAIAQILFSQEEAIEFRDAVDAIISRVENIED